MASGANNGPGNVTGSTITNAGTYQGRYRPRSPVESPGPLPAPLAWVNLNKCERPMPTLAIAVLAAVGYIIAYHTYGRWLSRTVFRLDPTAAVPSVQLRDDRDFVPTARSIVFGHHFTSIAGTGPIVGPALAVMWGWLPALLWVLFGSIFIGAVHDLGTLVISLRSRGQTVGDIAGRVLNRRVRVLFLTILLFALWIVLAIFGLVIASVFKKFPESVLPVFLQIPIAVWIGLRVHRRGGNLLIPSVIALGLMYATVWLGAGCPGLAWEGGHLAAGIQSINAGLSAWPTWLWTAVLLVYCYAASVMPVWVLLQPRDYINSLQLIGTLGLIVAGLAAAAVFGVGGRELVLVAPAVNPNPVGAPAMLPFLFVTIACGAISGFHCLVSSGTTSKQLKNEADAQFVGYGSMLTEGFLATLVILAVTAGIGFGWQGQFPNLAGSELWQAVYSDWGSANKTAVGAFVVGAANLITALHLDAVTAQALVAVLVASFAGTTLDTATRLQRYVVQELAGTFVNPPASGASDALRRAGAVMPPVMSGDGERLVDATTGAMTGPARQRFNPLVLLTTPHGATLFAVVTAFALALFPGPGKPWAADTIGTGGLILWPLFGATNQLLGGLAFLVVCFWLRRRGLPVFFAAIPAVFMLIMPAWAMGSELLYKWWPNREFLLCGIAVVSLLLEVWMVIEAILLWPKIRGVSERPLPPLPVREPMLAGRD